MMTELGGVTTVGIKVSEPSNPLPAEECIRDGMMEEREEFQEFQVKFFNKEITSAFSNEMNRIHVWGIDPPPPPSLSQQEGR